MEPLTPSEIAQAAGGNWAEPPGFRSFASGAVISGACTDTRTLAPGDIFIPLRGENFDGHDFIPQAWEKGAAAVMSARDLAAESCPGPVLWVKDPLEAYQKLARYYLETLQVNVVAVTGSNGKTTTKELIACLLGQVVPIHKNRENYNNEIGVPRTILELNARHRAAVLELAMRAPGEISALARICRPQVGVVTMIGEVHLEFLKTRQAIADAKGELLEELAADGVAVINADDPWSERLASRTRARVVTFGRRYGADITLEAAHPRGWDGYRVQIRTPRGLAALETPLLGPANLSNLLAAVAVAEQWEVSFEAMAAGLREFKPAHERMETFVTRAGFRVINDTYNSNPTAVALALQTLQGLPVTGRRIAVLGEMKELGPDGRQLHQETGRRVMESGVDLLITLGELAHEIAVGARQAGFTGKIIELESHSQVLSALKTRLAAGDTVLLKGSRALKMDEIVRDLKEFTFPAGGGKAM